MRKTITILFFASAILARAAEDFSWSWEKDSKPPSERRDDVPDVTKAASTLPAKPAAVKSSDKGGAAGDNFLWTWEKEATKVGDEPASNSADGQRVRSKTGTAAGVSRKSIPGASSLPAETETLPPEIDNLTGGVPKAGTQAQQPVAAPGSSSRRKPNPPSSPVVVPHPAEVPVAVKDVKTPASADNRSYDKLIQENIDLQKRVESQQKDKDLARIESQKLSRDTKDLEQRIGDSVEKIKELNRLKAGSLESPAKLRALEERLNKAEQEKNILVGQLAAIQKKDSGQQRVLPNKPMGPVAGKNVETVKAGSDLLEKLERENLLLKQKLAEIEAERQKAVRAKETTEKRQKEASEEAVRAATAQRQIKDRLKESEAAEKKQKKIMLDLAERIPDMEKELKTLQKKLSEKDSVLKEKDKSIEVLASEIHQRENRIRKAEKMVELMEQAQKDISQVSDNEKRDMHYNMAAVYSQVGRYSDAEREYLHALKIDPADADVHYNLGILYDENLRDKQRAALHYRRYLKLKPNGSDVDTVKNWLLNIDVNK